MKFFAKIALKQLNCRSRIMKNISYGNLKRCVNPSFLKKKFATTWLYQKENLSVGWLELSVISLLY